jgi:hypothetical protein
MPPSAEKVPFRPAGHPYSAGGGPVLPTPWTPAHCPPRPVRSQVVDAAFPDSPITDWRGPAHCGA